MTPERREEIAVYVERDGGGPPPFGGLLRACADLLAALDAAEQRAERAEADADRAWHWVNVMDVMEGDIYGEIDRDRDAHRAAVKQR